MAIATVKWMGGRCCIYISGLSTEDFKYHSTAIAYNQFRPDEAPHLDYTLRGASSSIVHNSVTCIRALRKH